MRLRLLTLGLVALMVASGCTCSSPARTQRSGTVDEPYVAQPLSDEAAGKKPFLDTSNEVISSLASGDLDEAYGLMDQVRIQRAKFDGMVRSVVAAQGPIVHFLPGQWWFIDDGEQVLSVKLVIFERGCGAARLMFDRGEPTRVRDMWLGDNACSAKAKDAREKLAVSGREAPAASPSRK